MIDKYKERDVCDMIFLHNKEASWDRKLNSYVLNFQGRANQVKKVIIYSDILSRLENAKIKLY